MPDDRETYERMLRYFWEEKGDIERYVSYDEERTRREQPLIWLAWENYKTAEAAMDAAITTLCA